MPIEYQILTAILPVLGLVVGAAIQYFYNKKLEGKKSLSNLRYQSYVDYVKAVAEYVRAPADKKDLSKVIDAKVRICVFGDDGVIKKLSDFENSGAKTFSNEGKEFFVGVISEMRQDIAGFNNDDELKLAIRKIIFGD